MKVIDGKILICRSIITLLILNLEAFLPRRGRINCSLNDNGKWRWFGTQFIITNN